MADGEDNCSLMDEDSTDSSESSSSAMKTPAKRMVTRRGVCGAAAAQRRQQTRGRGRQAHAQRSNLLQKLHTRQLYGKIQANSVSEETKVGDVGVISQQS